MRLFTTNQQTSHIFVLQAMYENDPTGAVERCKNFMTAGKFYDRALNFYDSLADKLYDHRMI